MAVIAPSGNGTHPSTKANIRNNSGYVVGNFTAGVVKGIGVNTLADDTGKSFGSKVVTNDGTGANTTDRVGVTGVVGANVAYNATSTQWIMNGVGVTTKLNNQTNNVLYSAGSDWNGKPYNSVTGTTGTKKHGEYASTEFDFYATSDGTITPNFTKGTGAGSTANFVRPSGNGTIAITSADLFATRAVPGELTYRMGGSLPVSTDYKAKDSFEA